MSSTIKFENREAIKEQHFNRGWCVKLCKEGKGYAIRLAQFNGEVKMLFRFDLPTAEKIYSETCKLFKN